MGRRLLHKKAIIDAASLLPFAHLDDGTPLYPLRGADSEDDNAGSEDDDNDDDDDEDDEDDEDDDKGVNSIPDPKDRRIAELSKEAKERRLANKKLKKDLEAVQSQLQDINDKDKSEVEQLREKVAKLTKDNEKMAEANQTNALERAFLKQNKIKWHNADAALRLMDMDEVEYDPETGDVSGMADAVKKLAKDHPYLVDTGDKKTDDDDEDGKGKKPTGSNPGSSKSSKRDAERAQLEKRFPVLGRIG